MGLTVQGRNEIAKVSFDEDDYCKSVGATEAFGEMGYTIPESLSTRPALELNGLRGGYQGKGIKTVLPQEASAKITCRLVADQEPEKIYELLNSHIEASTPRGVIASLRQLPDKANPFLVPIALNSSEIVGSVLQKFYDKEPYAIKVSGLIPVMSTLLEELCVHVTMFAFGLDDKQIHAPNEFFRLESLKKTQKAYCMLVEEFKFQTSFRRLNLVEGAFQLSELNCNGQIFRYR